MAPGKQELQRDEVLAQEGRLAYMGPDRLGSLSWTGEGTDAAGKFFGDD